MLRGNPGLTTTPRLILNGVVVASGVIAWAMIGATVPGRAQTVPVSASAPPPFDNLLEGLGLKAKLATAPDFVQKSRPAAGSTHFVPVGTPHPERPVKAMTPAEVAAVTADLDSSRTAQQRRAGLKPTAVPLKTSKTAAKASVKTLR